MRIFKRTGCLRLRAQVISACGCFVFYLLLRDSYHRPAVYDSTPPELPDVDDEDAGLPTRYDPDQTCKFPILDAFDESILPFVDHPPPFECPWIQPQLTFASGNSIYKNASEFALYNASSLRVRTYYRPTGSDLAVQFGEWMDWPSDVASLTIDKHGLEVSAMFTALHTHTVKSSKPNFGERQINRRRRYSNLYPSVLSTTKNNKQKKITKSTDKAAKTLQPPNVLIFGIDSVSRSNVVRNLPLTYRVLTHKLGGHVMRGYAKIDDNTFPNMMAVLSGHRVTIHGSELEGDTQKEFVDDWPLLWRNFSEHGYTTLLSEEQPGIFSYKAQGFQHAPTDVYLRPYGAIMANMDIYSRIKPLCFGNHPEVKLFLEVFGQQFEFKRL